MFHFSLSLEPKKNYSVQNDTRQQASGLGVRKTTGSGGDYGKLESIPPIQEAVTTQLYLALACRNARSSIYVKTPDILNSFFQNLKHFEKVNGVSHSSTLFPIGKQLLFFANT